MASPGSPIWRVPDEAECALMNPKLILVADDDPDIRDLMAYAVEKAGFQVVGAKDVDAGVLR
jgi:CheY-like chemotaxis protein